MADQACKSNNHSGFEGAYPGVALPSSNLEGTTEVGVPVLAQVRHRMVKKPVNPFRISLGDSRVYTTFAIELEMLR